MSIKKRIGSCSGPLDATLVRAYFDLHENEIEITINGWHDIEVDLRDATRARACLHRLRAPGCSLDNTLQASGHFEHLDDMLPPRPPTAPFVVERHQSPRPPIAQPLPPSSSAPRTSRLAAALNALRVVFRRG